MLCQEDCFECPFKDCQANGLGEMPEWYTELKEAQKKKARQREYNKRYREKHRGERKEYWQRYYQEHKEQKKIDRIKRERAREAMA